MARIPGHTAWADEVFVTAADHVGKFADIEVEKPMLNALSIGFSEYPA